MVARVRLLDNLAPPTEEGRDHAQNPKAEHRLARRGAEIIGVHPHHPAEEHDERRDRADHRPDAGVYEVIVMMFGTSHVAVPVFCPSPVIPHHPPVLD